jgi:hypothetical protein
MRTLRRSARKPRTPRSSTRRSARANEQAGGSPAFDKHEQRGGRFGNERPRQATREAFPPERVRQAGETGGEMLNGTVDSNVTAAADSPETLFDENLSRSPGERLHHDPADTILRDADESEIGEGTGLDEAELARKESRRKP